MTYWAHMSAYDPKLTLRENGLWPKTGQFTVENRTTIF